MQQDLLYMNRCLELASLGAGAVAPNPMVGAVLVYQNRIIAEGWHEHYGQPHAEVNCLKNVQLADQAFINQSTLYVSLEPCAHYGKTPPCADLIIRHKIPKVVIGCIDTFAKVSGLGIQKLKAAGIEVTLEGPWNSACQQLNQRFFTFHRHKRPFVLLKWAQSADQFIAAKNQAGQPESTKISHPLTDRLVHRWRSEEAAILVGKNTALLDNPALNNRLWARSDTGSDTSSGQNMTPGPIRMVIDKALQLPANAQMFQLPGQVKVFNQIKSAAAPGTSDSGSNIHNTAIMHYQLDWAQPVIPQLLACCYQENIQSILVEGGAQVLQSFIDGGFWDECRMITNTGLKLNSGLAAPILTSAEQIKVKCLGQDKISYFAPQKG